MSRVNLNGMNVHISTDPMNPTCNASMDYDPSKPHALRVRKAMWKRIEEMSKDPRWLAHIDSQNEKNNIPNMGGVC